MIAISRYSGKCDLFDSIEIHDGLDNLIYNSKVYIYEKQPDGTYKDKLLHFEKESDVVPYYAHIIGCAYHNNAENKHVIHLSSKSYPDSHEEEMLEWYKKTLVRYYNSCKRKKIEFNVNDALKKFSEWTLRYDGDTIKILAQRVKEKGKKASIEGLTLEFSERYREELRKELDRVLDKEEREKEKLKNKRKTSNEVKPHYVNFEPYNENDNSIIEIDVLTVNMKSNQTEEFIRKNNLVYIQGEYYYGKLNNEE